MTAPNANRPHPITVTVLGIGSMGSPVARVLKQKGFRVKAWNRTFHKAQHLASHGIEVCESLPDAVSSAQFVIAFLFDGDAVEQVLFKAGAAQAMPPGAVCIDMSSIRPEQARSHAQRLKAMGIEHLDAPVSGGTLGAEQGTLAIMVGGETQIFAQALSVLQAMGRAVHVGPSGAGQVAKLANQMIVGATIGIVAEALLLCQKAGADATKVREALRGGFADSRILEVHGERMIHRDFAPRGSVAVQLKDLDNALHTAQGMDYRAEITQAVTDLYRSAAEHGFGQLDQSGLFAELARRNQLS